MKPLMDAARVPRVELANGQCCLPLRPAGAPAPRAAVHALPRALTPGLRKPPPAPPAPPAPSAPSAPSAQTPRAIGRALAAGAATPDA